MCDAREATIAYTSLMRDLSSRPAYRISEAAGYLRLPSATLRAWSLGRDYPVRAGTKRFQPVIDIADRDAGYLSFTNLLEAHVLSAIRRQHQVSLSKVRNAVAYLRRHLGSAHPLVDHQFATNGVDLFVERLGRLINASRHGQIEMHHLLTLHLKRIERNPEGIPIRLYPFTHSEPEATAKGTVVIDPAISFGRPVIKRLGVPTAAIAARYKAGDAIEQLADDYAAHRDEIEEAIRCELPIKAA